MTGRRFTLDEPPFARLTGAGVRVAVIDSGVHPGNPHVVGAAISGVRIIGDDPPDDDYIDRIGHGTAVAAAILEKAPGIDLVAVRVFDTTLATSAGVLARAIRWSAEHGARLINLSLGTSNPARAEVLGAAVDDATAAGAIVVSAYESNGVRWLPGSLPNVVGVELGSESNFIIQTQTPSDGCVRFAASGLPRPIPGVPVERNLSGISFSVANVTGFLARLLEGCPDIRNTTSLSRHVSFR